MTENNIRSAYRITGAYRVKRKAEQYVSKNREHTAISVRIKGSSTFFYGDKAVFAGDGAVSYFPSGFDYLRKNISDEELIVIHLDTYGECFDEVCVQSGRCDLIPFFENILKEWECGEKGYNKCMSMLYELFESLDVTEDNVPKLIREGVSGIERDFRDSGVTVAALAARCHITEAYFRRLYKAHFGVSPHKALNTRRLEYSAKLLASGYYSVKEAAAMSGYNDTKYFRTAFLAEYGISPSAYVKERKPMPSGVHSDG